MGRLRPCRELSLHAPVASQVLSAQYERKGRTPAESSSAAPVPKASNASSSSSRTSHHVQMDSPSSLSNLKLKAQHALAVCQACNSQHAKKAQIWAESSTSVRSLRENNVATSSGLMSRHGQLAKCLSSRNLMAPHACATSQHLNAQHAKKGQTLAGSSSLAPNHRVNSAATSSGLMRLLRWLDRLANVGQPVSLGLCSKKVRTKEGRMLHVRRGSVTSSSGWTRTVAQALGLCQLRNRVDRVSLEMFLRMCVISAA